VEKAKEIGLLEKREPLFFPAKEGKRRFGDTMRIKKTLPSPLLEGKSPPFCRIFRWRTTEKNDEGEGEKSFISS